MVYHTMVHPLKGDPCTCICMYSSPSVCAKQTLSSSTQKNSNKHMHTSTLSIQPPETIKPPVYTGSPRVSIGPPAMYTDTDGSAFCPSLEAHEAKPCRALDVAPADGRARCVPRRSEHAPKTVPGRILMLFWGSNEVWARIRPSRRIIRQSKSLNCC